MSIDDLLGGLLGGSGLEEAPDEDAGAALGGQAGGAGGLDLDALLGGLLGGATPDLAGETGGAGGIDLGALLGGLLGGGTSELAGGAGGAGGIDLGALLGGLLGGGDAAASGSPSLDGLLSGLGGASDEQVSAQPATDINGLAEGMGLSPSILQAAIPLVLGGLLKGNLPSRAGDQPLDEAAVRATGVPQELAAKTGLDLPKAVLTVQQVLEWLREVTKPMGASGASARPKKRRRPSGPSQAAGSARPKETGSKPRRKKSEAQSKPRRKAKPKSASSARPKRPRRPTSKSGLAE